MRNAIRAGLAAAPFALLVGGTALGSILFAQYARAVAPIWVANGLAIVLLYKRPRSNLVAFAALAMVAICIANLIGGARLPLALGLGSINALEILLVSMAMRHFDLRLAEPRDLGKFTVIGFAAGTASALAGASLLTIAAGDPFLPTLKIWLLADFLGLVITVPAFATVTLQGVRKLFYPRRILEASAILAVTATVTALVFSQQVYPAPFLVLPCLLVAAFRLTSFGISLANGCVIVIAIGMTATGHGPIASSLPDLPSRMMFVQLFLAVNTLMVFPVASVLAHRNRTRESLEASERLHTLLADNTNDMVARIGFDGRRRYVSPSTFTVLGYTPEEVMTASDPLETIHPDDRAHVVAVCRSLLDGALDPSSTHRQRHRDGHYLWLESIFRLVSDPVTGAPLEFVVSTRDVSRRHAAEESLIRAAADLAESNRRLLMAEAAARVGHWRLCTATNRVFWSDEVYRIRGRHRGFAPNLENALADYHPEDAHKITRILQRTMLTGEPFRFTGRIVRPDGYLRWIESNGHPEYATDGSISGVFGTFRDVTEQVESQSQLIDARVAAERALAAKSVFTATISHEIRTPLAGILGVVDLLRDASTEADRRRYFTSLESSARLLSTIVDDVLILSKLEEGKVAIDAIDFDPRALVSDVIDAFAHEAQTKGLMLECQIAESLPAIAVGDPARLRRILANLISNAVKFTHAGAIIVSARAGDGDDEWRFAVSDTGIGIGEETLAIIFEPFTQADASISRRFGGTGLGLSICRMLVEAMGGTISVDSLRGRGSTFSFGVRMPAAEGLSHRAGIPIAVADEAWSRDILIAEDNDTNRFLVTRLVERLGHRVTCVADGSAAVAAAVARDRPFDLILMDIQMPLLDGIAATRAIRRLPGPAATAPIYAFSADVSPLHRDAMVAAGMDGVLGKPLRLAELERLVRSVGGATGDAEEQSVQKTGDIAGNPPIDPARIAGLERALGAAARDTLLTLLIRDSTRSHDTIKRLVAENNVDQLRREAHALRGAAGGVGAHALIDVLRELEAIADGDPIDPVVMARLDGAVTDVVAAARAAIQCGAAPSSDNSSERNASTA